VRIVDVSDPEQLVEVGFWDFNRRFASDLAIEPPIALVPDTVGIRVATVAKPANPRVIADVHVPTYDVEFVDGIGYSASGTDGLVIWDLSVPTSPQILGSAPVTDARDMALADGQVYLVGAVPPIRLYQRGPFELVVVDVADLAHPAERGRLALGESRFDVDIEVVGSIAYVALDSEVHVVDVSDPNEPLPLGSFRSCGHRVEIEVRGGRLFAAATSCGLDVFDLADPLRPRELGIVTPGFLSGRSVEAVGRIAYVGTSGSLETWDLGPEYAPEPDAFAAAGVALAGLQWAVRRRGTNSRRIERRTGDREEGFRVDPLPNDR
jgi:hypothetical protein